MEKTSKFIYFVICYVFFIFTDLYLSNILVDKLVHGYRLSNPVFSLNYIKNTGAAFSILQNSRELLIILSMIALVLLALHVIHNLKSISLKSCFFIALLSAGIAQAGLNKISVVNINCFYDFSGRVYFCWF